MNLEFRNVVTLSFVYGFFSVFGLVLYLESEKFTSTLADSQLANLMIGALIGAVVTITAVLYKQKANTGDGD